MSKTGGNLQLSQDANHVAAVENIKLANSAISNFHNLTFNFGAIQLAAGATVFVTLRDELTKNIFGLESRYILGIAALSIIVALIYIMSGKFSEYKRQLKVGRKYHELSNLTAEFIKWHGSDQIELERFPGWLKLDKDYQRDIQVSKNANSKFVKAIIFLAVGTILNISVLIFGI